VTTETIGFIGLGKMGLPIARRLAAAGHRIVAWTRPGRSVETAEAEGFGCQADLAELARCCNVLIAAVPDDAALLGLLDAGLARGMTAATTFIDLSTVSPTASAGIAVEIDNAGAAYLRSPVSGSTAAAVAGTLTAIVSGPKPAFDAMAAVYEAFTSRCFHVGDTEQARYLKLAINSMLGATSALLAEALALGETGGLDRATMLDVILQSAVASPLIGYKRDMLVHGDFAPAFSVSQMMKDIDIILSVGRSDHVPLPVNALVRQIYEEAYRSGHGDADFFALAGKSSQARPRAISR
jgi:3-hydroxyisobutyrate dehydrogenase-like beta-hydroxyacid dehydrogenase